MTKRVSKNVEKGKDIGRHVFMKIAENIRRARKRAGLRQQDLAKLVEISPTQISGYESGKSIPNAIMVSSIAKVCNTSIAFLYGETDNTGGKKQMATIATLQEMAEEVKKLHQEGREVAQRASTIVEKMKKILESL